MKKLSLIALSLASAGAFAQFTADNLLVVRVGDGSAALNNAATVTNVDQLTQSGTLVNSTAAGVTLSGTASSEGSLYNYGSGVSFGGYAAAAGTSGVVGTATARLAGRIDFSGTSASTVSITATSTPFSANNIRGVAYNGNNSVLTNSPTGFIAVGANTGVVRGDLTGAAQVVSNAPLTNIRNVIIAGNDVFFSSGSTPTGTTTRGVWVVAGGVSGTGLTATNVFNYGTSSSVYDFQRLDNGDFIFADDRTAAGGGLIRWNSAANTFSTLAAAGDAAGLGTGISIRHFVTRGNSVFATTTEASNNRIVRMDFASPDFGGAITYTNVASAGTNQVFRGIEAVPEPASMAAIAVGLFGLATRRRKS